MYCRSVGPSSRALRKCRDRNRQVVLFDDGVGPYPPQQLLFLEEVALVLHQDLQQVEGLQGQRHHLALAKQAPLTGVEQEWTERVAVYPLCRHQRR